MCVSLVEHLPDANLHALRPPREDTIDPSQSQVTAFIAWYHGLRGGQANPHQAVNLTRHEAMLAYV